MSSKTITAPPLTPKYARSQLPFTSEDGSTLLTPKFIEDGDNYVPVVALGGVEGIGPLSGTVVANIGNPGDLAHESTQLELLQHAQEGRAEVAESLLDIVSELVDIQSNQVDGDQKTQVIGSLPIGHNHIGSVTIDNFSATTTIQSILAPLPVGNNKLGSVNIDNFPTTFNVANFPAVTTINSIKESLPPGHNHIGSVTIANTLPMSRHPRAYYAGDRLKKGLVAPGESLYFPSEAAIEEFRVHCYVGACIINLRNGTTVILFEGENISWKVDSYPVSITAATESIFALFATELLPFDVPAQKEEAALAAT